MVRTNHFIFMFLMLGYTVPHTPRRGGGLGCWKGLSCEGQGGRGLRKKNSPMYQKTWHMMCEINALRVLSLYSNSYYILFQQLLLSYFSNTLQIGPPKKKSFSRQKNELFYPFFCSRDKSQSTKRMELLKTKIGPQDYEQQLT